MLGVYLFLVTGGVSFHLVITCGMNMTVHFNVTIRVFFILVHDHKRTQANQSTFYSGIMDRYT